LITVPLILSSAEYGLDTEAFLLLEENTVKEMLYEKHQTGNRLKLLSNLKAYVSI